MIKSYTCKATTDIIDDYLHNLCQTANQEAKAYGLKIISTSHSFISGGRFMWITLIVTLEDDGE